MTALDMLRRHRAEHYRNKRFERQRRKVLSWMAAIALGLWCWLEFFHLIGWI